VGPSKAVSHYRTLAPANPARSTAYSDRRTPQAFTLPQTPLELPCTPLTPLLTHYYSNPVLCCVKKKKKTVGFQAPVLKLC